MVNVGIRVAFALGTAWALLSACGGGEEADLSDDPSDDGGGEGGTASGGSTGKTCAEPSGPGTQHENWLIEADETWTAEDSPHYVTQDTAIRGATLTLEKCAIVVLSENVSIQIGESNGPDAKLVARGIIDGVDELPVVFTSESASTYWTSIWLSTTGTLDIEGTILHRGGSVDTSNDNGAIVYGGQNDFPLVNNLRVVNSAISESAGFGVNLGNYTGFSDDSSNLVIQDVGLEEPTSNLDTLYPIFVTTGGISSIPTGKYAENEHGSILAYGGARYPNDVTIHDRGVPYTFESDLHIEPDDETPITLTLEAGVRLEFKKGYDGSDARFRVALGSQDDTDAPVNPRPVQLIADGTAEKPIVLTSAEAEAEAGDWVGIDWGGGTSDGNVMSYVTVEYAGADSQASGFGCGNDANNEGATNGALFITDWRPSESFITNSTFSHSAGGGIVSGWDSVSEGPDLTSDNTFEDIAAEFCNVSQPAVSGVCPGNDDIADCYD